MAGAFRLTRELVLRGRARAIHCNARSTVYDLKEYSACREYYCLSTTIAIEIGQYHPGIHDIQAKNYDTKETAVSSTHSYAVASHLEDLDTISSSLILVHIRSITRVLKIEEVFEVK